MEKEQSIYEKFKDGLGDWAETVRPILESDKMYDLYQEFKNEKEILTPRRVDIFNFLKYCPRDKLKLVIIGLDSYPGRYSNKQLQATGIAFDCSNSPEGKLQPSLVSFWDGISADLEEELPQHADLKFLCEQGVILSNRALNCKIHKTGSLVGKWDFFWEFFLRDVLLGFPSVPVILLGKEAQRLEKMVFNMNNPVFKLSHPSFAARTQSLWETNKVFSKVNKLIEQNNGKEYCIDWSGKSLEVPF